MSRFLVVASMILLGYATNIIINPVYHYSMGSLELEVQINLIAIILLTIIGMFIGLAYILNKREFDLSTNKKVIKKIYIFLIICIAIVILIVYFGKFKSGFLYEINQILHGNLNDEFGTYRIFLWKRSVTLVEDYPILGTGPDTFAVRFMDKYAGDVAQIGELTINDTAANVYLTMLVNIGIIGVCIYLIFIVLQLVNALKNKNKYSTIFLIAFICFIIQDFFNLWVVIITPIFWILMAIQFISISNSCTKEMEEKNEK